MLRDIDMQLIFPDDSVIELPLFAKIVGIKIRGCRPIAYKFSREEQTELDAKPGATDDWIENCLKKALQK